MELAKEDVNSKNRWDFVNTAINLKSFILKKAGDLRSNHMTKSKTL